MDKVSLNQFEAINNGIAVLDQSADQSTVKKTMEVALTALVTIVPAALIVCARTFTASVENIIPVAIWVLLGIFITVKTAITETPKDWLETLKNEEAIDALKRENECVRADDNDEKTSTVDPLRAASNAMHEDGKNYVPVGIRV